MDKGEHDPCPMCRKHIGAESSWARVQEMVQKLSQVVKQNRIEKIRNNILVQRMKRLQQDLVHTRDEKEKPNLLKPPAEDDYCIIIHELINPH